MASDTLTPCWKKPHAVIVPYPLIGHINPMLELAKVLLSYGFVITFVNTKRNHDRLSRIHDSSSGIASVDHEDIRFRWVADGLPPDFDDSNIKDHFEDFHQAALDMQGPFEDLLEDLCPPATCIIYGSFMSWSQNVGNKFKVPTVFFWTQSAAVFSIYYNLPQLTSHGFFPYQPKGKETITYIPGVPPLLPADLPSLLHVEDPSHRSTQLMLNQFEQLQDSEWVFVNSYYDLERNVLDALQICELHSKICSVGPLIPPAFLGELHDATHLAANDNGLVRKSLLVESGECIKWLDGHSASSVLFISFGSLFQHSHEQMEEIAAGLKASQQPFLWAMRPNSKFADLAKVQYWSKFLEDTNGQGLIIPWAPQLQVLSHPAVGGFMSHCGWNSTLESLSMGVPMLPLPLSSDQLTNCRYIVDVWKVGVNLKKQDDCWVKGEDVEVGVRTILVHEEGEVMRRNAVKLRAAARKAMEKGGSSRKGLEQFITAMRKRATA